MSHRRVRVMPGDALTAGRATMAAKWKPYKYRDPERCSPDRLAELAAHDEHIARLNYLLAYPYRKRKGRA